LNALVLCAGLGTRLRPLTERYPKPALPLLGQPLLRTTLGVLARSGVKAVGINTHHLPEVMQSVAQAECLRVGLSLSVFHEPTIQGTGGGIRGLRYAVDGADPFVVFNGDILFPLDLGPVLAEHQARGAAATLVLMPMPRGERYAAVECNQEGEVRRIAGIGPGGPMLTPWHFTGVHVMGPRVFDFMRTEGPEDINREVYPRLLEAGLRIHGARVSGYWSDLGTPARYLATVEDLLSSRTPLASLGPDSPFAGAREVAPGCWVRGDARIEGTLVAPAFIDAEARVHPGAVCGPVAYVGAGGGLGEGSQISRSAVLEGGEVKPGEKLESAIVWPGGRL
jgi:mannose-1-phosphate guanylyltransferase